jgi:hypothetical protein
MKDGGRHRPIVDEQTKPATAPIRNPWAEADADRYFMARIRWLLPNGHDSSWWRLWLALWLFRARERACQLLLWVLRRQLARHLARRQRYDTRNR